MNIGDKAPDFVLLNQADEEVQLSKLAGKWVVVYLYPKDNTPGCTVEAIDFSALKGEFEKLNAVILGVSKDSTKSHRGFISKQDLTISLLSDPENRMIEAYGAWQLKKNYGKEYLGIVRSTFLIDPAGNIAHVWDKVTAKGHAQEVLDTLIKCIG